MRELSLFTGAGGGVLASHLLGWQTLGYVEYADYAQRVIAARIRDGYLPNAPIFGDIRSFISEGYAESYTGMVDVVSGGFPCQPFSVAGKQAGKDDPRNMWPATIATIRIIQPRFAFLENVPGLVTSGYFGTILGDLAESGFDCRWRILSAAEMGGPHRRDRIWIVAYPKGAGTGAHEHRVWGGAKRFRKRNQAGQMAHPNGAGLEKRQGQNTGRARKDGGTKPGRSEWWAVEPGLGRVANGVGNRVDRLKAIGNGQVPAVAARAWQLLTADLSGI